MEPRGGRAVVERRLDGDHERDDFPTPPWATRALFEDALAQLIDIAELKTQTCWEPAAGAGYMSMVLDEYFGVVYRSDVHDYAGRYSNGARNWLLGSFVQDKQHPKILGQPPIVDWVITNPPFKLGLEFILRANKVARVGVAMLLRTVFLEGGARHEQLFSVNPPTTTAVFSGRVAMVKGRYDPNATTATSYSWFIWIKGFAPQSLIWIPPTAKVRLTREADSLL